MTQNSSLRITFAIYALPGNFAHRSDKVIWLRCPGCKYGCGRHHEWKARVADLTYRMTRNGGYMGCPSCDSNGGSFCECQSVANDPMLYREWHPNNPPARDVVKSSHSKFLWVCTIGHPPYTASCNHRFTHNTGCPVCGVTMRARHPVISVGRPDLALEWDTKRNTRSPDEVTLGSGYMAGWVCSRNLDHLPWQVRVKNRALMGTGCPECSLEDRWKVRPPKQFGSITS